MHPILLLLHNGFSIMIIRKFFMYYDSGEYSSAIAALMNPGESEDLMTIAYRYLQALQLYLVEENDKPRPIVVIAPGGGYLTVSIKEVGDKTALQYNASGFHAAVLNYCVKPHRFPEPQMDLALSIKLLRDNAEEWGIDKNMIVVCGFSAGGHLCASLSTLWNNDNLFHCQRYSLKYINQMPLFYVQQFLRQRYLIVKIFWQRTLEEILKN